MSMTRRRPWDEKRNRYPDEEARSAAWRSRLFVVSVCLVNGSRNHLRFASSPAQVRANCEWLTRNRRVRYADVFNPEGKWICVFENGKRLPPVKKPPRHTHALWLLGDGFTAWCWKCGALRPAGGEWLKPVGANGENPQIKWLKGGGV